MKKEPHVAKYKKQIVEDFARLIKEYPIVGAVNMENLPAPQLQKMRSQLRNMIVLKMCKRRLLKIAIEKAKKDKPGIEKIEQHLIGMPALLFTKENPFKLYKIIQKSKSKAPAKAGQIAPYDIIIPAGPTPFAPGPIIGELGMLGIKTTVEAGKVAVAKDSVIVKEGETIKPKVAELLTRFGIEPMEIGLDIVAVYEKGTIYTKNILAIDEAAFLKQLQDAHTWAFNLAVEAGYYTKDVLEVIIPKAFNESKALAKEANIMCDLLAEELVEKAERQALSLKTEVKIPEEKPKVEEKPKPKVEEKPPEKPKEEPKPEPEKPKEAPKVEEAKPEEVPKPEEPPKEKPKEEKEKEIKEELEKIEEEVKEEQKKPEPKIEEIEKIEKEVEKVEEEVKEVEEKKEVPSAHELKKELDEQKQEPKKEHVEAESLYEELKKKGTLRDIEKKKEEEKPKGKLTPEEIIEKHKKKMENK